MVLPFYHQGGEFQNSQNQALQPTTVLTMYQRCTVNLRHFELEMMPLRNSDTSCLEGVNVIHRKTPIPSLILCVLP